MKGLRWSNDMLKSFKQKNKHWQSNNLPEDKWAEHYKTVLSQITKFWKISAGLSLKIGSSFNVKNELFCCKAK